MAGQFVIRCDSSTRELRFRGRQPEGEAERHSFGHARYAPLWWPESVVNRLCAAGRSTPGDFRIRFDPTRVHNPAVRSQAGDDRDLILWLESVEVCT